jgi:hypothetical protein
MWASTLSMKWSCTSMYHHGQGRVQARGCCVVWKFIGCGCTPLSLVSKSIPALDDRLCSCASSQAFTSKPLHRTAIFLLTCPVSGWALKLHILWFLSTFHTPCTSLSTPELPLLLCSAVFCHALLHSLVLCQVAFLCLGPLSHALPGIPLASPIHLIPFSFLVTTCTLVPGPLALLSI